MVVPYIAAAAAGVAATAAYLDAKYQIRHDLGFRGIASTSPEAVKFMDEKSKQDRLLTYHILEDHAFGDRANHEFLVFEDRSWTYRQFYDDIQKVGHWLMDLGIEKKEVVALDGGNSPEYIMLWFALDAIGVAPAFINNNLTSDPLLHCVQLAKSRFLIADSAVEPLISSSQEALTSSGIKTVYYSERWANDLPARGPIPPERSKGLKIEDLRCLIYTSGTTGMPKGTIMGTGRDLNTGRGVASYLRLQPSDRFYTCMPLYHGAAHGLCVTPSVHAGCTVILSRKFSHRTFWPEVREHRATIIQYVGELCRYLLNAPPDPLDRAHVVQMAWGNGMRPDVWEPFRQRFGITTINELYAATDGLGASFNANRGAFTANAVGVHGLLWQLANGKNEFQVKVDPVSEELLRDKHGFAIKCKTNEPGETVYKMDPATADAVFAGYYQNKSASDKRKISGLFEKGDLWFRSGDMHRVDADGRVFFVDRLGDTFRWHSENVSTNEVSDVIGHHPQIDEANVYGVTVPHADGRAGCAAVVLAAGVGALDLQGVAAHALAKLPRYAVPVFLRVTPQLAYTGTLKLQKGTLRQEGIDLRKVEAAGDKMFWLPPGASAYAPFGAKEAAELEAGKVRL